MNIIPEPISFDWDLGNSDKNLIKHQVANQEAEEVFINEPLIIVDDKTHSNSERRFNGLGKTNKKRLLYLSFTIRNNKVRIISIRDMDKKEKYEYQKI